jgi:nicotinate phosphoribosyltransferase
MAYKLVCYDGRPVMKLSTDKVYRPGAKQVFRFNDREGMFSRDVIGLETEQPAAGDPLLEPVMDQGKRAGPERSLNQAKDWFEHDFAQLDSHFKVLGGAPRFPVDVSPALEQFTRQVQSTIGSEDF